MDDTQSSSNLQPTGTSSANTNNPQQNVQGSLQPQADSNLQPTSNQSVESINNLDSGSTAISVSGIPNTSTTTAPLPTSETTSTQPFILYGLAVVVCASILAYLIYDSIKSKPATASELEPAPEPVAKPAATTKKPKKSKKSKKTKKSKKR